MHALDVDVPISFLLSSVQARLKDRRAWTFPGNRGQRLAWMHFLGLRHLFPFTRDELNGVHSRSSVMVLCLKRSRWGLINTASCIAHVEWHCQFRDIDSDNAGVGRVFARLVCAKDSRPRGVLLQLGELVWENRAAVH